MTHTPGPWHAAYNGDEVCVGTDADEFVAMTLPCNRDVATARDYANARLIAAAPDMLSALIDIRDSTAYCAASKARAAMAIDKATKED